MFLKTKTGNITRKLFSDDPNGYLESIQKGLSAVRYFSNRMSFGSGTKEDRITRLKKEIEINVPSFLKRATEKTPCRPVGSLLPAADRLIPALPCREEPLDHGTEDLIDHSTDEVEDRSVNDEEGGIVHDDSNQLICGVYGK